MLEHKSGIGRLVSRQGDGREWKVKFDFAIYTRIIERPGFPRVAAKSNSNGKLYALSGEALPEGEYDLYCDDGEIMRVCNLGLGEWAMLAPE
jgi:hypothetical protein